MVLFFKKEQIPSPITAARCALLAAALLLPQAARARLVPVADSAALAQAVAAARPGDDIVLADGQYTVAHKLLAASSGRADAPISLRAAHPLSAQINVSGLIGFEVTGAYWSFAGLSLRGVCAEDTNCEHAFHVVGAADFFHLQNSRLVNFNAHLKVNADASHHLPAHGLVRNNEVFNTHPRHTNNPVAPINIDNALFWRVEANTVHDFQKDGTGEGSYGIFVKGGAQAPVLADNIVTCARDAPPLGRMVGLSFGAHGMDPKLCPPHWDAQVPCNPEVTGGIMRNNTVSACNDDGIYLNQARDSQILNNHLAHTGGIHFRFTGSSGVARGNTGDARVVVTDGARVQ